MPRKDGEVVTAALAAYAKYIFSGADYNRLISDMGYLY